MAIKMTREEYQKIYGGTPVTSTPQPQQGQVNLGISDAFKGGISQAKAGYEQSRQATNPLQFVEGGIKSAAGVFGAAFSPLAPLNKPIEAGINYAGEKISNIPTVQKFATSRTGEITSRVAEDVGNLAGVAGGVAGAMEIAPGIKTAATNVGETMKPAVAGTGRILKATGEGSYGITTPPSEGTARALQTYKESSPNLMNRIKNTVSGETKGKPITEANTAARYGLMGTEQEIGVQAGRYMKQIWNEKVAPALSESKGKLDMKKFFDVVEQKIIKDTPELTRRNDLIEGLNALKSEYGKVNKVGLSKLQSYKEGWASTLPEATWKGKPIASALKEVKKVASDTAREFIYKNTPPEIQQHYIDYGNLKSIREAGIKSGVGDLAKKSISRGAWQMVMDKAVTPIATTMGRILYKTGEGLEFIGESGAKTVGDIVGNKKPNMQSGMIKNPFYQQDQVLKDLNNLDTLPVKSNKGLQFGNTDANFRLQQLKEKMQTKPLSETEIQEAQTLLKQVGGSNDSQISPLMQEAKKYKSAEEFVKARGQKVFHGTEASNIINKEGFKLMPDRGVSAYGDGVYLSTKSSDAKGYGGVVEAYLPKDIKLFEAKSSEPYTVNTKKLISEGYDGVRVKQPNGAENLVIFDPAKIKTKSQLTDIWNKANKKTK